MRFQKINNGFSPLSFSLTVSNRSLKLSKEGVFFIILTIGIGFGAVNTGINLLYLILAMCLSFIIVSGVLSEITLRRLSVIRKIPKEIFAQQPFPVQVEARNNKKWFPTYSIWIEEDLDSSMNIPKLYFYHIKTRESENKNILWVLPKRGIFKTNGIKISTKYPFGFFIKTALYKKTEERVIYPAIKTLDDISDQLAGKGETTSGIKGEGSDIFGFREFTHGDSSKMIHWKTSAKVNNLMIKEHFIEENPRITIIFDNKINAEQIKKDSIERPGPQPNGLLPVAQQKLWQKNTPLQVCSAEINKKFDDGVTQAASLANHFIRDGCQVEMITRIQGIPSGSGFNHLSRILYHLALLDLVEEKANHSLEVQDVGTEVIHLSYAGEYL